MGFYESIIRPLAFALPAETAHDAGIRLLKVGSGFLRTSDPAELWPDGSISLMGIEFPNPLGMAAGFDKNGKVVDELASLGFGSVEVGTVTLRPQKGNPKPRMFRLPADKALINRLGFNNEGARAVVERLEKVRRNCVIGVNIGKNKDVPVSEAVENYLETFRLVHPVADYIVLNVSSPNTPGLRDLQHEEHLESLLSEVQSANSSFKNRRPLVLKIAPDLDEADIERIADAAVRNGIDGVIATNTTVSRDGLVTDSKRVETIGDGGLSGAPLLEMSNTVLGRLRSLLPDDVALFGVGGVMNATDAFEKMKLGADIVQTYTGFVYGGPNLARTLLNELSRLVAVRRGA